MAVKGDTMRRLLQRIAAEFIFSQLYNLTGTKNTSQGTYWEGGFWSKDAQLPYLWTM